MAQKPTPPAEIPTYVAEGIERQDQATLRAVIRYAEDLLEHYDRDLDEEELADAGEEVVDVEDGSSGTIVVKKVPCGKNCGGCPHGPYRYRVQREGDSLSWEYLGAAEGADSGLT